MIVKTWEVEATPAGIVLTLNGQPFALGYSAEAIGFGLNHALNEVKFQAAWESAVRPSPLESSADAAGEWAVDAAMAERERE